jgi:hypothetical protein
VFPRCPVCLAAQANIALRPCGHCVCDACMNALFPVAFNLANRQRCPVCRENVQDSLQIHFAL